MCLGSRVMGSVRWFVNSNQWKPSKSDWMRAAQCIQPEEKERIGKFVFQRDAKSSMIGRLLLRKLIHRMTRIPYGDIRLSRTDKGKPFLENDLPCSCPSLSFNVSHQGELVVLAAETDHIVGIDVMNSETPRMKSVSDFFHTMRRQFTEEEWKTIRSHDTEGEQLRTFYRLWCLKESYVKALGVGIGFEVKRLGFTLDTPSLTEGVPVCSTTLKVDGTPVRGWRFEETVIQNHTVTVAIQSRTHTQCNSDGSIPTFTEFTFSDLIWDMGTLSEPDDHYGNQFMKKTEDPFTHRQKHVS